MMNRAQERSLRSLCRKGGALKLPSSQGPIVIRVKILQRANHPDKASALLLDCMDNSWLTLDDMPPRELYADIAERLEDQYDIISDADDCVQEVFS